MKAFVITGVSGGLGQALFEKITAVDGEVKVIAISRRFLPEQEALAAEQPERVRLVRRDLNQVAELPTAEEFAEYLADERIDEVVFINNAAIVDPIGAVGSLDPAVLIESSQINLAAAMVLTNALFAVPKVGEAKVTVRVLNISSGAAKRVIAGWAAYCAVKAGNEMFFDVLAEQYADQPHVQIHNVNPGVMDTRMQGKIRAAEFPTRQRFVSLKEEGQLPSPEQVATKIWGEYISS
ncbi:SDR family NAD(P)-dependent oxidoreductase [Tumebacillus sp. DT12]|uniref:SDR family NAD(P)-dependent oxidoreductase n=1 Tax=Tumebacillus lacus TaxID=2995335 RepID=A0ABT3WWW6_9BACL|nr:SDR family NAD(P)-dependent oxidoreductase [Tumebacillus lacus]MCX7569174.1 SDR family NAD(P)-dependent oxidoreductase [Tumebacillus lacus]